MKMSHLTSCFKDKTVINYEHIGTRVAKEKKMQYSKMKKKKNKRENSAACQLHKQAEVEFLLLFNLHFFLLGLLSFFSSTLVGKEEKNEEKER